MNILGLHYGHDGAACIVKEGKIAAAISTERLTKQKKAPGVTDEVIDYVIAASNLTFEEVDVICLADYFSEHAQGTLDLYIENRPVHNTSQMVFFNEVVYGIGKMRDRWLQVIILPHHLCHCASAYFTSPFDSSWCFSLDSSGGAIQANSLIAYGEGNKLYARDHPGLMIGVGYADFTELCGIGPALFKAGTMMGLAAYGEPCADVVTHIDSYIQQSYFRNDSYIDYYPNLFFKWSKSKRKLTHSESASPEAFMLAASIQYLLERCVRDVLEFKIQKHETYNLCLSGGTLLNCNTNSYIATHSSFKQFHHFPGCGDDGIAVGAALYVHHHIFNNPKTIYKFKEICYLGKPSPIQEPNYKEIAEYLAKGSIVAWFFGGSEYGPRALGNRSILADPRNFHNRELINFVIKNREWYRPFAPVVLEEYYKDWFEFDFPSPFMLYTAKVRQPKEIPAVTHIDGSARFQTVNKETNLYYYNLIQAFYEITGVPVLLNTSLNGNSEPILETVQDAYHFMETSNVDFLVLNGETFRK